jgi:insertion element IS1 protein InsB
MNCPRCGSGRTVRHGRIHHGKAKRLGQDCCRQFVPDATKQVISPQTWELVNKLLLERIPLAGSARVTGLSEDDLSAITGVARFDDDGVFHRGLLRPAWGLR